MKKIIFMGAAGSGKTTLCQKLAGENIKYVKTQALIINEDTIDTPGEYMENRHYYSALITTSADADIIAIVADATRQEHYIPPAFAATFAKEVIGIITKISIGENISAAEEALKSAGINKIFRVDTIDGTGIDKLTNYLEE